MKPRILYVWQARYPWDVRVEKVCNGLQRNGFEVEILARQGKDEEQIAFTAEPEKIAIHRVGPAGPLSLPIPGNPFWKAAIKKRLREFKPDLVIARDIPLALPTAHACASTQIPMVIDMAEHYPVAMRTWKKYQANPFTRFLINTLKLPDHIEKKSVLLAAGILPVCEEQKERLVHEYHCDPHKIVPVLNTPELSRIPPSRDTKSLPASSDSPITFGYHGVVIQDRDLLTVVRGFDLAAKKNSRLRLVIYGGGESLTDIENEVSKLQHKSQITLHGPFKSTDSARLYSEIDFGIVSWKVNEFTNNTIANKFFDYAGFGKPILYTRTRPMINLMKTMQCGVGFEKENPQSVCDGIFKLIESDYETLSSNGIQAVRKEFNWENDTHRMVQFIHQLIGKRVDKRIGRKHDRSCV